MRPADMKGLAGWLFADLLLVLFVTAFATTTTPSAPPTHPTTPTPKPTASPRPTPKPTPHQAVLVLVPYDFTLPLPSSGILTASGATTNGTTAADRVLAGELKAKLDKKGLGNRRAGLVEAFGSSPQPSQYAINVAKAACYSLQRNLPLFSKVYPQPYWTSGSEGSVSLTVFFFATNG